MIFGAFLTASLFFVSSTGNLVCTCGFDTDPEGGRGGLINASSAGVYGLGAAR